MTENKNAYVDISVRAFSKDSDPNVVTDLLRITPTCIQRAGEVRKILRTGRKLYHMVNGWLVVRLFPIENACFSDLLNDVLDELNIDEAKSELLRESGFDLDVYVGVFYAPTTWGFELSPDLMVKLGGMGMRFSMSVYW